jgi:hypothetical protein
MMRLSPEPKTEAMTRILEASLALMQVTPDDLAITDPVAVGLLRTELARLIALTDERMRETP